MAQTNLDTVEMTRPDGEAIIYVPKRSNFTRIIVTLTRNQTLWLTSLGWRPEEKSVALTCDNTASGLAIKLPKKFARDIQPEDVIQITCTELGFIGETAWGGTAAPVAEEAPPGEASASPPPAKPLQTAPTVQTQAGNKKYLLSGIAALAILGVIGILVIGTGKSEPAGPTGTQAAKTADASAVSILEQKKADAEAVAAEIAQKKDEADRREAKAIQDKDDANAEAEAEAEAEAKRKIERAGALERANLARDEAKREAAEKKKAAKAIADKERAEKRAALAAKNAKERAAKAKPKPVTPAAPAPAEPSAISVSDIKAMQENLTYMGYYWGPIDGVLSSNTESSVELFKSIFELPDSLSVNQTLLREIEKQRGLYVRQPLVPEAETVTPEPFVSSPNIADIGLDRSDASFAAPSVPVSVPTIPSPQSSEVGLTKPVLVRRPELEYPSRPKGRSSVADVVTVVVSYGVDTDGKPIDAKVISNDYSGLFETDFNKAAIRLAENQRFEPALRDNVPVEVGDLTLTLAFKK